MWSFENSVYFYIFNVGRGLSIFIKLPNNTAIIYDLGSSTDFSPLEFVKDNFLRHLQSYKEKNIAQMILSHPHADHISELSKWIENKDELSVCLLTCQNDKAENEDKSLIINMDRIRTDDNMDLIESYKSIYEDRHLPLQTIKKEDTQNISNLEYGIYYINSEFANKNEVQDEDYVNGLSIILYIKYFGNSILIPGDITPNCINEILHDRNSKKCFTYFDNDELSQRSTQIAVKPAEPSLGSKVQEGLSVLIAPHHGLESCFSPDLFSFLNKGKVKLNVISEKVHDGENDGQISANYSSSDYSTGLQLTINGENKTQNSISTRKGHILIIFKPDDSQPEVHIEREAENLLTY